MLESFGVYLQKHKEVVMTKRFTYLRSLLAELHGEESGQDLIEYALIAALIALAATVGMEDEPPLWGAAPRAPF